MGTLRSIDPASGETVWEGPQADPETARTAVAAARSAFPAWAATPLGTRVAHVRAFKAVLEARAAEFAETIARETGKPLWESSGEVASMIAKTELSIAAQAERAGERRANAAFGESILRHRPHGVMAVFGPYNFPGHLPNGHIVPALLAGNTVVFKPSELTPATAALTADAWADAGLPQGVLGLVQGGAETGKALAAADIDGLLFTGSAATGALLRRQFVDRPGVILALELGGNNPLIAWDGDISEAAALVVQSAFASSGQRCSCARRLIVPDTAFGRDLVDTVARLAGQLTIGAWSDRPEPYLGPLVSDAAARHARAQAQGLAGLGARCIVPLGEIAGRREAFVTPALFDVTGIDAPDQEIFAPLLQVSRVPDFAAALATANRTRFGLAAGLISEDDALWARFVGEIRAGVVNRNRPTTGASGSMPFGGLGESGNHRPSAWYAADYCAYPVASFEAVAAHGQAAELAQFLQP